MAAGAGRGRGERGAGRGEVPCAREAAKAFARGGFCVSRGPSRKAVRDTKIELRGLEQNPNTESRWAKLARAGHKVMQFLSAGRYIGVVVNGKVTLYGGKKSSDKPVSRKKMGE